MKEEKRRKIIETARKLFVEKGYKETKVEDITKEMGISKGNFYTYFKTKEDVLFAIIEKKKESLKKLLDEIEIDRNPKKTLENYLKKTIESFLLNFSRINPVNIHDMIKSEKLYSEIMKIKKIEREFIQRNIVEKSNYKGDIDFISRFVVLTIDSFLFKEVIEDNIGDEKTYYNREKEKFAQIIEFIYKGLNN